MAAPTLFTSRVLCCVCPHMCARETASSRALLYIAQSCVFLLCILAPGPCVSVSLCARWSRSTPTCAQSHRFGFRHCGGRTLMAGRGPRILSVKLFIACVSICALFFYGENKTQMLGDNSKTQWKIMPRSSDRLY